MRIEAKPQLTHSNKRPKRIARTHLKKRRLSATDIPTDTSLNQRTHRTRKAPRVNKIQKQFEFSMHFEQAVLNRLAHLCHRLRLSLSTGRFSFELLKRFLLKNKFPEVDPFLLVLGSLLICSKFYESWGKVLIEDLVAYCGNSYGRKAIVEIEALILDTIGFEVVTSLPRACEIQKGSE